VTGQFAKDSCWNVWNTNIFAKILDFRENETFRELKSFSLFYKIFAFRENPKIDFRFNSKPTKKNLDFTLPQKLVQLRTGDGSIDLRFDKSTKLF
jgi:hypothetical protein